MLHIRPHDVPPLLIWGTAVVFVTMLIGWWHHKRKRNDNIPRSWRTVGTLSELTIFPIKSCAGIQIVEAECTECGIQTVNDGPFKLRDRFFIIYDENTGEFKTARTYPKMVLIKMTIVGDNVVKLSAPNVTDLQLEISNDSLNGEQTKCKMWAGETIGTADCGDAAAKWLSMYIMDKENGVRLGYYLADTMSRRVAAKDVKKCYKTLRNRDLGIYSDLSSFMLMTESSVNDLKTKIPAHVAIGPRQFRPNFLVRGTEPYEEDKWQWIRIGETAIFRNVKPCTRCIFTTIDPVTGRMEPKREPLKTLKRYRQLTDPALVKLEGSSPAFGINLGLYHNGTVKVGDTVCVGIL